MNKYQCQVCGAVSYSAASQENLKDNSCLECDGRVEMVEGDKMNADEIMRAFRERAKDSNRRGFSGEASELMEISDLIESLQAQLAASQRRERAAVEDMKLIVDAVREEHCDETCCFACKFDCDTSITDSGDYACECPGFERDDCFEWRGPQDEEGE